VGTDLVRAEDPHRYHIVHPSWVCRYVLHTADYTLTFYGLLWLYMAHYIMQLFMTDYTITFLLIWYDIIFCNVLYVLTCSITSVCHLSWYSIVGPKNVKRNMTFLEILHHDLMWHTIILFLHFLCPSILWCFVTLFMTCYIIKLITTYYDMTFYDIIWHMQHLLLHAKFVIFYSIPCCDLFITYYMRTLYDIYREYYDFSLVCYSFLNKILRQGLATWACCTFISILQLNQWNTRD